jgi:hypothetical protein
MYYRGCLENHLVGEKNQKMRKRDAASKHASAKSIKRLKAVFSSQRSFVRQINFFGNYAERQNKADKARRRVRRVNLMCAPQ